MGAETMDVYVRTRRHTRAPASVCQRMSRWTSQ
jgi:hypothetical protein